MRENAYDEGVSDTTKAPRGRPRQFDPEAVLDELTEVFWRKGYSQTTVADIVEASGVHKPSLYRTFGTKDELFATVLHRYFEDRMRAVDELIERAEPGIEGIHATLELLLDSLTSDTSQTGCLLINSSSELCGTVPGFEHFGLKYRDSLRQRIRVLITHVGLERTANDETVDQRTDLFVNFVIGLNVTARSGADASELRRVVDAMHATVETWGR